MADPPYLIQTLQLDGFRAFLRPKAFDFSKKRCLAVFAPNGNGKSSVIDALEFMFSKEGTLDRLGIRAINNQAGFIALAHNLAEEAKIAPRVLIDFVRGKESWNVSRPAVGTKRPMPAIAATVGGCFAVSPIIRGHDLRKFVEIHTPEQRYMDVATWLRLGPLVEVQKNLRALRTLIKAAAEDTTAMQRVNTQLARATDNAVVEWIGPIVLGHANVAIIAPLDKTLVLKALDGADAVYAVLAARAEDEERKVGLVGLRQIRTAAVGLWNQDKVRAGETPDDGSILTFEAAAEDLSKAEKAEADERGKAANATFQAVWKAAEPLFAEGVANPKTCPICATPMAETKAGSTEGVRAHLAKHLEELAGYAAAKRALDNATAAANKAQMRVVAALPSSRPGTHNTL